MQVTKNTGISSQKKWNKLKTWAGKVPKTVISEKPWLIKKLFENAPVTNIEGK